jgi:hypothetical protein
LGSGIDAVADLERLAEIGDSADKFVVDLALDKKPSPGAADLSRIGKHRHAGARHRAFEVGVGKDDVGRFAAEFERHALQITGRGLHNQLARQMRAGEGHLVDPGVGGERGAGGLAIARHDVDDSRRYAGIHQQFAEP